MFSPRPWGWPVVFETAVRFGRVFPTPVGMARRRRRINFGRFGFPHARGDGPIMDQQAAMNARFSPRPWGWPAAAGFLRESCAVFPTPVGMARRCAPGKASACRFPHARGDGPVGSKDSLNPLTFSPRPWGWPDDRLPLHLRGHVFPTPVGMARSTVPRTSCGHGFPHARGDGPDSDTCPTNGYMFSPRPWGWPGLG